MKRNKEYLVFDNAKNFENVKPEDMKPLDMSVIAKQIAEAYNEALFQKIEANTIIINEKYAKVKNTVCPGPFVGEWNISPMLCGLRVKFDDLPEQFAFALTKFPIKTEEDLKKEVRNQTAKEILKELLFSVENCKKKDILWYIESISKRYGVELFGKTEQVGGRSMTEQELRDKIVEIAREYGIDLLENNSLQEAEK